MPAKYSDVMLGCRGCGNKFAYRHYVKISGDDYPDLKAKVLSGELFHAACPSCRCITNIVANMRYSDYSKSKGFFVYLIPEDMMEPERSFIESLGGLRSDGTRVHLAHTLAELQSIIKTYDAGFKYPETHIFQSREGMAKSKQLDASMADFYNKMKGLDKPKRSIWDRLMGR